MDTNFAVSVTHIDPTETAEPTGSAPSPLDAAAWVMRLALAPRACCCSAKPAVAAVMPTSPARPEPVDLLLCAHHYRASAVGLELAGAVIHTGSRW
jgi:hypothetical protein